jgi:hypothetical protein
VDFIDDIIKIEIITAGDRKTDKFFKEFKEQLKQLLKQIDILITAQKYSHDLISASSSPAHHRLPSLRRYCQLSGCQGERCSRTRLK